jgi:hypothetical protein
MGRVAFPPVSALESLFFMSLRSVFAAFVRKLIEEQYFGHNNHDIDQSAT